MIRRPSLKDYANLKELLYSWVACFSAIVIFSAISIVASTEMSPEDGFMLWAVITLPCSALVKIFFEGMMLKVGSTIADVGDADDAIQYIKNLKADLENAEEFLK